MSDNIEEKIKQWYKDLPEITLPNLESEDGTHLEVNLLELVKFTEALINKARIEELERLQKIMNSPAKLFVEDRLQELKSKQEGEG